MFRKGFISIHRKIEDNWLWGLQPFDKARAWIDLILLANYKPNKIYIRGNCVEIKKGELAWSTQKLAERWGWSRKKVANYLDVLEKEERIEQKRSNVINLIYVKNYEQYQENLPEQKEQQNAQQKNEAASQILDIEEEEIPKKEQQSSQQKSNRNLQILDRINAKKEQQSRQQISKARSQVLRYNGINNIQKEQQSSQQNLPPILAKKSTINKGKENKEIKENSKKEKKKTKKGVLVKKSESSCQILFDQFWEYYTPVKTTNGIFTAKGNYDITYNIYKQLLREGVDHVDVMDGLMEYLKYCRDNDKYTCTAKTFLNERRYAEKWSDDVYLPANKKSQGKGNEEAIMSFINDDEQLKEVEQ